MAVCVAVVGCFSVILLVAVNDCVSVTVCVAVVESVSALVCVAVKDSVSVVVSVAVTDSLSVVVFVVVVDSTSVRVSVAASVTGPALDELLQEQVQLLRCPGKILAHATNTVRDTYGVFVLSKGSPRRFSAGLPPQSPPMLPAILHCELLASLPHPGILFAQPDIFLLPYRKPRHHNLARRRRD